MANDRSRATTAAGRKLPRACRRVPTLLALMRAAFAGRLRRWRVPAMAPVGLVRPERLLQVDLRDGLLRPLPQRGEQRGP
eukprot:CAMPEP_0176288436 /NCGR_PEP_ID=MMETSP0121_2-20121125/53970_1 /TAXON_ID=160619 /ORGANISM="Kryptoperidinium foliaceum, Strain CCMP 1326" /LENGTH=79 /DNA_ID=CAMNT_0017629123 /DNA_START=17 /DNA_END=253 /DNA_ORIENTATION=+